MHQTIVILSALFSVVLSNMYGAHFGGYGGHGGFEGPMMSKPYSFGYAAKGHGGESHHHESGVGGKSVHGSYGYTDMKGLHREVSYVADHGGFRAEVKTNEPGTAPQHPAAVKMMSAAHPYFGAGMGMHMGAGHGAGGMW